MAEKRMFTKKITDADEFVSLPSSTQALYLHLCMAADDDGFNNQVQMAMFKAHASVDDLRVLLSKRFILQFESGVIVIKHWRMANALRKDRYTATAYQEELKMLKIKDNGAYSLTDGMVANWLPNGCQTVASDKNSIDKSSIEKNSIDNTLCSEPKTDLAHEPEDKVFITLILNDKSEYEVTESYVKKMQELYPAVDVPQAMRSMSAWCINKPKQRKTRSGITRFINTWLSKEQDRGGNRGGNRDNREDMIRRFVDG